VFLGANIGTGTVGSIDTARKPLHYAGDGDVAGIDLHRFGEGLDVGWLRDPRYAGTLSGHFRVEGIGADAATMALTGGGHVTRAELFKGVLSDGDVTIDIHAGTVRGSYAGGLAQIDPAVPFEDPQYEASLTGTGRVSVIAHDLLIRDTTLNDYDVDGALTLGPSTVRKLHVDRGRLEASLTASTLTATHLELAGPELNGTASGTLSFADDSVSNLSYNLTRVDLARLRDMTGQQVSGVLATKGQATGPYSALRLVGDANIMQLDVSDVRATTVSGTYDITLPSGDFAKSTARVEGRGSFVTIAGRSIQEVSGTVNYTESRVGFDVAVTAREGRSGKFAGNATLDLDRRTASIQDLTVDVGSSAWRLLPQTPAATIAWSSDGLAISAVEFVNGREDERVRASGTWRYDGSGALHVTANHVFLETLTTAFEQPSRYGGLIDLDATIGGTRDHPRVTAALTVSSGRVERVTYQQLTGRVDYRDDNLDIDLRLDQSPGIWITAVGTVPMALFDAAGPDRPVNVAIKSSGIDLGLLEGLTDVVRGVSGELHVDVRAVGTTKDPHFEGSVTVAKAAFAVAATGAKYKNASAALTLTTDRVAVDSLRVEDSNGRALDVHGSLGTHELKVGDLEIEITGRRFEVLRNELGRIEIDASLMLRGRYEQPRLAGDLTISSGNVRVDEILQRTLFQPYGTEQTAFGEVDAIAAMNPWNRIGIDVSLHSPNTLRLTGENVQISPGTPIGLGDINLRVLGDLYLYKDPGQPMSVTGSFDQVTGTYAFQGRRFDVAPASSINFHGDLNPEIYVTVTRVISGVETRVSIFGPMDHPELRLASTPPLDASDILSLIVFNTSTNQLSAQQQQELVVRAGTLAAGFIASPIVSAIENEIGIDLLEIEPGGDFGAGPRLTVGEEIAPGLVARFSRQFGLEPYDEATIEYYLSRVFRLRATFSDAQTLNARSPFRRVERAGIDLLLFFSF
jgi:translocation and assembly module TamB